jgi:branched-chain amino acid transport system permease protein
MAPVSKLAAVAAFFLVTLVGVPWLIAATQRWDLYYTLTSVALLAVASGGVWLTFFWLTLPLAGLFCAAVSVLIGLPILRLRGVYFAMVTLVLTEVARLLALALPITNGAKGMVSIPLPGPITLFGMTLVPDFATLANPRQAFYVASVLLMALCYAGLYRLVHSRMGRLCLSLQQNEELASSIGVNIAYLRVIIYAISSFLGGIGGAMFVAISQSIYPSSFTVTDSINFMLNCFLGGLGSVLGPVVGTFLLYFGWDLLFKTGQFQLLIFSSIIIALMLILPNGLLSLRVVKVTGLFGARAGRRVDILGLRPFRRAKGASQ